MTQLLKKFDLTSLRLFLAVCQERSIARAAERECITPSAVSRRIAEIEALIGLPVVVRESRGISVTAVGETVMRYAEAVIANLEGMEAELSRYATGAKGSVRIVANLSAVVQFLPEDISSFKRVFPEVDIEIDEQTSVNVLRSVREGDVDFGICNATSPAEGLDLRTYRSDRLVLMIPAGHRLGNALTVRLADVVGEHFVGLRSDASLMRLLAEQAQKLDAKLDVKIRVGSLDALCRMVHVRLGVAVVPQQIGELYINTLNVKLVPIAEDWAVRTLMIACRNLEHLAAPAAALVNFLTDKR
ncbi:LysR substrate-binding domain-containing protein [Burkholderia plantarii]|uniref:Transcriptional regulator, LysR family n=1 Tax=Burkholderia plantarii TaxID=41899 RepID=A0A0B6RV70_BURPL|nr:LysR substrate-binding domain-containing protein [Burkholderia plantarii]AJK44960.1 transcriptional regulator, LysR family [Burkholderia plantarii]ALK29237.1 LysR family transcriptional regulator [Burkholderia plantarii]GLZ21040.1 LysR family transcriptional regulator [Burkholderia plantarii]